MSDIEPTRELPTIPIKDIDIDIKIAWNYFMSALYKKYSNKYSTPLIRLYVLQYITNRVCNKTAIELNKKLTTKKKIEELRLLLQNK